MRSVILLISAFLMSAQTALADNAGAVTPRDWVSTAIDRLCPIAPLTGSAAQGALPGTWLLEEVRRPDTDQPFLVTLRLMLPDTGELKIERRQSGPQLRQFRVSHFSGGMEATEPTLLAIADGSCTVQSGRSIRSERDNRRYLDQLDGDLETLRWTETLQAPWPEGEDSGGIRVALVDSGLAYDLPVFRDRLARDAGGTPLGYDFWDLDPFPYDGDTSRGPFLPIRHGTPVASVLIREAPAAMLIPFRYPRPDMSRMADLVDRAARAGARILAMPLGSRTPEHWAQFAEALARHDMLAIVSAGNDGRNIDLDPLWPAALDLDNMIVVTSSDDSGRLADRANSGPRSVDIMLPAENIDIIDFRGASGSASGSSYAVPRLAALAVRLLQKEPELSAADLRRRILDRAVPSPFQDGKVVAAGWIPDPLAD